MGILHMSLLNTMPGVELVAAVERHPLVQRFARKVFPRMRIVNDVAELAGEGVDAVYITTPPSSHFPVVASTYGNSIAKHIFSEKPLANSYGQAQQMLAMAEVVGGVHMTAFQKHFSLVAEKAVELLAQGVVGDVESFSGYAFSSDFANFTGDARQARMRGGVLRDLGCHAIDLTLWLMGDVAEVGEVTRRIDGATSSDDSYVTQVTTTAGLKGTISISSSMADYRLPQIGLHVQGSRGLLKLDEDKLELHLPGEQPQVWIKQNFDDATPFLLAEPEYYRESAAFIEAVRTGNTTGLPSFAAGAAVEKIIDDINQRTSSNGR